MSKAQNQAHAGSVAVHLDAVEISVIAKALPLFSREFRDRARAIESAKTDGWQLESALLGAHAKVATELSVRLGGLRQYELPFGFIRAQLVPVARPADVAGFFPREVRNRMLEGGVK